MNYYWFNRHSKEKAAEYYLQNKEATKEKSREHYKNLSQEKKTRLKSIKKIYISRIGSV